MELNAIHGNLHIYMCVCVKAVASTKCTVPQSGGVGEMNGVDVDCIVCGMNTRCVM